MPAPLGSNRFPISRLSLMNCQKRRPVHSILLSVGSWLSRTTFRTRRIFMRLIQSLTEKTLLITSWTHRVPGRLGLVGLLVLGGLFLGGLTGTAAPKKPKKSIHPTINFNFVPGQ